MRPYLMWKKQGLNEPLLVSHVDILGCKVGPDIHLTDAGFKIGSSGPSVEWNSVVGAYAGVDPKRNCGALGWTLLIMVNLLILALGVLGGGSATSFGFDNQKGVVIVSNKRRRWRFGHSRRVVASAINNLPPPIPSARDSLLADGADYEFFGMASVSELTITATELIEIVNAEARSPYGQLLRGSSV